MTVPEIPKAVSRSLSVNHVGSPSFRMSLFKPLPAEVASPVDSTMPLSNGKLDEPRSKYPKLPIPIDDPFEGY